MTWASPENNFAAGSAQRTVIDRSAAPVLRGAADANPHVEAMRAVKQLGASRLVCFGLPFPADLQAALVGALPRIIAVDHEAHADWAKQTFPKLGVEWRSDDVGSVTGLEVLAAELGTAEPTVFLLSMQLERLVDPRPLLRTLKRLMLDAPSRLVVWAVDRGESTEVAPGHVRAWNRDELRRMLESFGFELEPAGNARGATHVVTASLSRSNYDRFLERHHLPSSRVRKLIVSSEHGQLKVTGGIGAYVEEKLALSHGAAALALVANDSVLPDASVIDGLRWLTPARLGLARTGPRAPDTALALVRQALAFYPDVQTIELQDYLGLGARVVQAQRAGLLPASVRTEVVCHGAAPYLERSSERWREPVELTTASEERVAIERADRVVFPTRFLERLYDEAGYVVPAERRTIRRYPFTRLLVPTPELEVRRADTLVFLGKRTRMKGFPLFVAALEKLLQTPAGAKVARVVVIGPRDESLKDENAALAKLPARVAVTELNLTRSDTLSTLAELAPRAICCTPYTADNHPVAVLEVIAAGGHLVGTRTGGIPELIPMRLHTQCLVAPDADELAALLAENLEIDAAARTARVRAIYEGVAREQHFINDEVEGELREPGIEVERRTPSPVSVIVPCFNTELNLVEDLLWGLNQQTLRPERVIFVDDGSATDYAPRLQKLVHERLKLPAMFVRHGVNRGLPAARNTALREVQTPYVVNIDSDDVPKNDFLRDYVHALDVDPKAAAATSFLDYFPDGSDWRVVSSTEPEGYRPLGEGFIAGQMDNCLGHANSAFRVSVLREVGGWDQADSSMWEDWALFLRLISRGHHIAVVPRGNGLYRYRGTSMARSFGRFPAQWRLGRAPLGLPRFEALRLQGLLRASDAAHHRLEERLHRSEAEREAAASQLTELRAQHAALEQEHGRLRNRLGREVIALIERQPEVYDRLRALLDTTKVTLRRLRSRLPNGDDR
jgi:glycosyltransferase involved in cell wall biosynthesis